MVSHTVESEVFGDERRWKGGIHRLAHSACLYSYPLGSGGCVLMGQPKCGSKAMVSV